MAIPVWWRRLDRLAVVYFWAVTLSSVVVGLVVTLPENYKVYGPGQLLLRYVIFLYLVLNVLGNYVQCVRHQSIVPPIELPLPLPRDWKHCMFCQAYVPPRARHCVTCSACILRRERHCALTACCVGHRNLRFAVGLSLHALAASLHSLLLSLGYLVERDGPLNLRALPGYVWPAAVWRYAHGWESTTDLVVCILANMHAMHCVVCAPALAFQLVLASDGQTAHEAQAGVNTYDLGCLDNLHQVFGQNLILPFLFPVAAPICGDGIEWRHRRKDSSLVC